MKAEELMMVLALAAVVCGGGAMAQSGCGGAVSSLAPCLSYVSGGSAVPSSSCCGRLEAVVKSSPECLCSFINGGTFGISINQTLALQLPSSCNVQTPPPSRCVSKNNGPISSPANSPAVSPADLDTPDAAPTPAAQHFPSGAGSNSVPSSNGGGWYSNRDMQHVLFVTFIALVLSLPKF